MPGGPCRPSDHAHQDRRRCRRYVRGGGRGCRAAGAPIASCSRTCRRLSLGEIDQGRSGVAPSDSPEGSVLGADHHYLGAMELFEALMSTRAMRELKADPVPRADQMRIIDAAIRAPSGVNNQPWHFVLVGRPDLIAAIGEIQRQAATQVFRSLVAERPPEQGYEDLARVGASGAQLVRDFDRLGLVLLAFSRGDARGGSIYPAVWSAMLAARGVGLGSVLTYSTDEGGCEIGSLVGVPEDEGWRLAAVVPMGYPEAKWGVPRRRPVQEVAGRNRWDGPL